MRSSPTLSCPCDTGRAYEACCAPYHRGEREAPDALSLMRSRYSAFARRDVAHLLRTMHPDHAALEEGVEQVRRALEESLEVDRYEGLRVLDQRPPGSDGLAEVLFYARVVIGRFDRSFVEHSYFAHDGTGWRYLSGELVPSWALRGRIAGLTIEAFTRVAEARR